MVLVSLWMRQFGMCIYWVRGLDPMIWKFLELHINFEPFLLFVAEMICLKGLRTRRLLDCIELGGGRRKVFYRKVRVKHWSFSPGNNFIGR